jgi:hypothetical protein
VKKSALLAVLFLAACGGVPIPLPQKVPLASEEADAQGKQFAPAAGSANLYIARTSLIGSRYRFGILLDGKPAGVVGLSTHLLLEVAPGEHRLSATSPENEDVRVVDAKAGQSYFFELKSRTGTAYARAELHPLAEADGKAAVVQTRRAAPW